MKKLIAFMLVLAVLASMTVCAFAAEQAGDAEPEEEEETLAVIGEETEDGYKVRIVNMTGYDITGLSIKRSDDEEFPDNMMAEDTVLENEEAAWLCYTPGEEEDEETLYEIQITWSDGDEGVVHDVSLADMEEVELCWDGRAYLVYTSVSTGEEVDTLIAERTLAGVINTNSSSSYSYSGSYSYGGDAGCLNDGLFW